MSQTETPPVEKQPFLKAPVIILVLIALMLIMQALMATGGQTVRISFIVEMGLFPARFFAEGLGGLPGGLSQGIVTLFTYAFVHGGWAHCLINMAFLLAFGSPVAKRLGPRRFFYLFALCIILAGLGQILVTASDAYLIPIIGASGGVAGMVGAASRFAFTQGTWPTYAAGDQRRRLLALRDVPKNRSVMLFVIIWLGMNFIFGMLGPLGMGTPDGAPTNIAWVAHLIGFLSGMLLIGLFEKPPLSSSGGPGNVDFGEWKKPN